MRRRTGLRHTTTEWSVIMHPSYRPRTRVTILIWLGLLSLLLAACAGTPVSRTYTVGVINYNQQLSPVFDGFKAQMAELGYVEGENITYLNNGVVAPDPQAIDDEIKRLLNQKVDLLLTIGTPVTAAAKNAVAGTDVPVVFAPLVNPVEEGIVESINRPGGNVTGVQNINAALKAMEWLLQIAPRTKQIYVPYHPDDRVSVTMTKPMPEAAAQLGVELVLDDVRSPEEALTAIAELPQDAGIIFIPMPSLESGRSAMGKLASERGIPAGASINAKPGTVDDVIFTYTANVAKQGGQAGRLADQIFKGTKPGNLPVETSEYFLVINLKNAQVMGLDISDEVLRQADTVIR